MTSRILFALVLIMAVAAGYAWGASSTSTPTNAELCSSMQRIQNRAQALSSSFADTAAAADRTLVLTKRVSAATTAMAVVDRLPAAREVEGRPEGRPAEAAPY